MALRMRAASREVGRSRKDTRGVKFLFFDLTRYLKTPESKSYVEKGKTFLRR